MGKSLIALGVCMYLMNDKLLSAHGFEPWQSGGMNGYYRRITFKKSGLIGPVAEYSADDYIICEHQGAQSVQYLLQTRKGIADVVTQRFLLVGYTDDSIHAKSFWFGLKGWLKIRGCTEASDKSCKAFTDLLHLALDKSQL